MWIEHVPRGSHARGLKLFNRPEIAEERTAEGVFLVPPEAPGIGIEVDDAVAGSALIAE